MAIERTLCIIKPDAVEATNQGAILQAILDAGFKVLALKQIHMGREQAGAFYAVHSERPFFGELVEFMSSGPIIVAALEADNAVAKYRELIGATNPKEAAEGTIRQRFGAELAKNAVHGSDSVANGDRETAFFFSGWELGNKLA